MMLTVWFFHFSMAFTGMTPLLLRFLLAAERVGAFCCGSLLITHFIDAPLQITWFILGVDVVYAWFDMPVVICWNAYSDALGLMPISALSASGDLP